MALRGKDAMTLVRDDLVARVDAIDRRADRLRPGEMAYELEAIRRIANRHGIGPAITVVHAIDSAVSRGERGPLVHSWLAILRDAVGSTGASKHASETYAAACAVRLAG